MTPPVPPTAPTATAKLEAGTSAAVAESAAHVDPAVETFSPTELLSALKQWLEFGEDTYNPQKRIGDRCGHGGYFNGCGWAARVLRWHLSVIEENVRAAGATSATRSETTAQVNAVSSPSSAVGSLP